MRLSMEEVRKQHDGIKKLYEQGLRGATANVEQVLDLFDTIEAIQQENEQLKADIRGKDNEINDLKAIIEYLRKFKPKKNEAVREENV